MENELRFFLNEVIKPSLDDGSFEPKYLVTAVKLPTGAIELAINDSNIAKKVDYILEAYDEEMRLKTNKDVMMMNVMVV